MRFKNNVFKTLAYSKYLKSHNYYKYRNQARCYSWDWFLLYRVIFSRAMEEIFTIKRKIEFEPSSAVLIFLI